MHYVAIREDWGQTLTEFMYTSLLSSDGYGSTLDATIFDTLGVLWTIFDGMGSVSICSTEGTCVGTKNWTGHFSISIFQIVRGVKTLTFTIIATEDAHLKIGKTD